MAGKTPRPPASETRVLVPRLSHCPECQHPLWVGYHQHRQVATLAGVLGLSVHVRHCPNPGCERYHRAYRPEEEGRIVLPHYEYGLDVLALLGALRYQHHETVIEIHRDLVERGVSIGQRNVTYLLDRYDELVHLGLNSSVVRPPVACPGRSTSRASPSSGCSSQ